MSLNGLFHHMHIGSLPFHTTTLPPHSTCWIPNSDSGDLKKSKKGCRFLKVCQKPWGLGMIRISIEVEMSLNA